MRHNRVLDSQCFQRAANTAKLGKGLREQGEFPAPVENHTFKHSFGPLSASAECSRGFAAGGERVAERLSLFSRDLRNVFKFFSCVSHPLPK